MRVLVVAPYSALPSDKFVNRFSYLARSFAARGHSTTFVTSQFSHRLKRHHDDEGPAALDDNLKVVLVPNRKYKSHIGINRVLSLRDFKLNFDRLFPCLNGFDIVYSAYPPIGHNLSLINKINKEKTRLVVDIQDVWPESFSAVLPVLGRLPVRHFPFSRSANRAYSSADALVAVSKTYLERAISVNRQVPSLVAYLGTEFKIQENVPSRLEPIKLFYIGTLSYSYDLETIIKAVGEVVSRGVNIELNIFGDGPDMGRLQGMRHTGTKFHGAIPYKDLEVELRQQHVAVNAIRLKAPQSVTNKLCDYLGLGCPILNSQESEEVRELLSGDVHRHYRAGDVGSAIQAILSLSSSSGLFDIWKPGSSFARSAISKNIVDFVEDLASQKRVKK